jgi:hypothetical protein
MSFNRPGYLEKVLHSLKSQVDCDIDERVIVLFQDGAVNPYSKLRRASDEKIGASVDIFQSIFPNAAVRASSNNLGVAFNFDRAEKFGFEDLKAEAVIFLEDDLILSPNYISILDSLIAEFANDQRVGYLAAYGDHTKSLEDQQKNKHRLIALGHNWAFALYRRQWLKMRSRVLEYLKVIERCDYVDRDHELIRSLFYSWGRGCPATSQDAAKTIACCTDGAIKINTYVCNGAYIGEHGLHTDARLFAERGYSKTVMFPEKVSRMLPLDDKTYQNLLNAHLAWASVKIPIQAKKV